jgi:hypothetical protein
MPGKANGGSSILAAGTSEATTGSQAEAIEWAWDERHAGQNVKLGTSVTLNDDDGQPFAKGVVDEEPRVETDKMAMVKVLSLRCPQSNWGKDQRLEMEQEQDLMTLQELCSAVSTERPGAVKGETLFVDTDDNDFLEQAQIMVQDKSSGPRYLNQGQCISIKSATQTAESDYPMAFDPYAAVENYKDGKSVSIAKGENKKYPYSLAVFVDKNQTSDWGTGTEKGAMSWANKFSHEDSAYDLSTLEGGMALANHMRYRIAARHNTLMEVEQQRFVEATQGKPNKLRVRVKDFVSPVAVPGFKLAIWKHGTEGPAATAASGASNELAVGALIQVRNGAPSKDDNWLAAKVVGVGPTQGTGSGDALGEHEYAISYELEEGIFGAAPEAAAVTSKVKVVKSIPLDDGRSNFAVQFVGAGQREKGDVRLRDGELSYDLDRADLDEGCFPNEGCFLDVAVTDRTHGARSRAEEQVGRCRVPLVACDQLRVTVNRADLRLASKYKKDEDPCVKVRVYRRIEDRNGVAKLLLLDEQRATGFNAQGNSQPNWDETLEFLVPKYDSGQLRGISTVDPQSRDSQLIQARTDGKLGELFVECEVCQGDETSDFSQGLTFIGSAQVHISDTTFVTSESIAPGGSTRASPTDAEQGDFFPEARVSFQDRKGTILRNNGPTCRVRVDNVDPAAIDEVVTVNSELLKFEGGSVMNFLRGGHRTVETKCALDGNADKPGVVRTSSALPGGVSQNAGSVTLTFEYKQVETMSRSFDSQAAEDPTSGEEEETAKVTTDTEVWNNSMDNSLWDTEAKPGRQHVSKVGGEPGARRLHNASVNVEWMHYHEVLGLPPYNSLVTKFRRRRPEDVPVVLCLVGGNQEVTYTLSDCLQFEPRDRLLRIEAIDPERSNSPEGTTNVWLTGNHLALFELVRKSMTRDKGAGIMQQFKIMQNLSSSLIVTIKEGQNLKNMDAGLLENPCGYTCTTDAAVVKDVSDPYVEVSLMQGGKLVEGCIQRTPTIMNNLNPKWSKCLHVKLEPDHSAQDGQGAHLGISGFNAMGVHMEAEIIQGSGQREKVLVDGWGTGSRQKFNVPGDGGSRYVKFMRVEPKIDRLKLSFFKKAGGESFGYAEVDLSDRKIFPLNDAGVSTRGLTSNGLAKVVTDISDNRGRLGEISFELGFEMEGDRMEFGNILDFDNQQDYKLQVIVKDKDNHVILGRDDMVGMIAGDGIALAAIDPEGIRTYERTFELVDENEDPTDSFLNLGIKWAKGRGGAITKGSNCVFELPYDLRKVTITGSDGEDTSGDAAAGKRNGFRKDLAICTGGQQTVRASAPLRSAGSEAKETHENNAQAQYLPGDMVECNYLSVNSNNRANGGAASGSFFRAKVLHDGLSSDTDEPNKKFWYPCVGTSMMRPTAAKGTARPNKHFDLKKDYGVGELVVVNYRNRQPPRWVEATVVTVSGGLFGTEICVPKRNKGGKAEWTDAGKKLKKRIEDHGGVARGDPTANTKFIVHPDALGDTEGKPLVNVNNALKNKRTYTIISRADLSRLGATSALDSTIDAVLNIAIKSLIENSKNPPATGLYDLSLTKRPTEDDLQRAAGTYRLQYVPSPNPTDKLDSLDKPETVMAYNNGAQRGGQSKRTQLYLRVQKFMSEHSDPAWRKDNSQWLGLDSGKPGAKEEKAPPRNAQKQGSNCATLDDWLEQYDANDYDIDKVNSSLIKHLEANRVSELEANKKSSNSKWSTGWKCISGLNQVKTSSIDVNIKKAWNLRRTDALGAEGTDPYVRLTLVRVQDVNGTSAEPAAKQFLKEIEAGITLASLLKGSPKRPGLQVTRLSDKNAYRTRHVKSNKHPDWTKTGQDRQTDWPQIVTLQVPRAKEGINREELCVVIEVWDYDNPRLRPLQAETDELSCTAAVPLDPAIFQENPADATALPTGSDGKRDDPTPHFRIVRVESTVKFGESVSISSPLRQGGAGWNPQAIAEPKWDVIASPIKPQDFGVEMHQPRDARAAGGKGNVGADKQFKSCIQISLSDNLLLPDTTTQDKSVQEAVVNWYKKFFPDDPNFKEPDSIRAWLKREFKNVTRAKIRLQENRVNEVLRRNYKVSLEQGNGKSEDFGSDLVAERPLEHCVDEAVGLQSLRNASGGSAHVFEVELNWSLLGCGVGVVGENFERYNGYMCDDVDGYCLWWDGSAFSKTHQTLEFLRKPDLDDEPLGGGGGELQLSTINPGDRIRMDVNMQDQSVTFYRRDVQNPEKALVKLATINNLPKVVYPAVSFCDGTTCSSARLLKKQHQA